MCSRSRKKPLQGKWVLDFDMEKVLSVSTFPQFSFIQVFCFLIKIKKLVTPPLQYQCATDISKSKFMDSRDRKWDLLKKFESWEVEYWEKIWKSRPRIMHNAKTSKTGIWLQAIARKVEISTMHHLMLSLSLDMITYCARPAVPFNGS